MRVLLLGPTGNLGLRCMPALVAYNHEVTVYVRNLEKLRSLVSPELLSKLHAIVVGDATDSAGIRKALVENNIDGIVDVAGNQVLPWREYELPKIAKAAIDAAVEVGKERRRPLRIWVTTGLFFLEYPEGGCLADRLFSLATVQHGATRDVTVAVPVADLSWSLICVSQMRASNRQQGPFVPLKEPKKHNLLVQHTILPGYQASFLPKIPLIGNFSQLLLWGLYTYVTSYENVADLLADDLANGGDKFVGKLVGYKEIEKVKDA